MKATQETSERCEMGAEIVNLSGYRFVTLEHLPILQADLQASLGATGVKGTVLLAPEGINVALAGTAPETLAVRNLFDDDPRFSSLWLKESRSQSRPFAKLKVRVRHEIIAFDGPGAESLPPRPKAPALPPGELHQWLNQNRDFVLLDTRNDYEIASGSFKTATHLDISHFRHFKQAVSRALQNGELDTRQPMVTFCTGGIRCEKAAPWLLEQGFEQVFQIEGGILNYLAECGDAHWKGECFVFDDRVEVDASLAPTGARWCTHCHRAIAANTECQCPGSDNDSSGDTGSSSDTGSEGNQGSSAIDIV